MFHPTLHHWPFPRRIHRCTADSPHKGPIMWKAFSLHDSMMLFVSCVAQLDIYTWLACSFLFLSRLPTLIHHRRCCVICTSAICICTDAISWLYTLHIDENWQCYLYVISRHITITEEITTLMQPVSESHSLRMNKSCWQSTAVYIISIVLDVSALFPLDTFPNTTLLCIKWRKN